MNLLFQDNPDKNRIYENNTIIFIERPKKGEIKHVSP